ncbi:MAG: ice-binding family protein [Acidimicrobiia bacterium]
MTHQPAAIRRFGAAAIACSLTVATVLLVGGSANAAIVPTVGLGTTDQYSVLAGSTVTNVISAGTVLHQSLGLSPGTAVTGFPPGLVVAPGVQNITNAAAAQAKLDLTAAYGDAAGRPVGANTGADLANLHLGPGVYRAASERECVAYTASLVSERRLRSQDPC